MPLLIIIFLTSFILGATAQEPSKAKTENIPSIPTEKPVETPQEDALPLVSKATVHTRKDARTMTLSIPAPRGLIMDRNGSVLANNIVKNYLCLQFPELATTDESKILTWARERIDLAKKLTKGDWSISDKKILSHYTHRRWLPLQLPPLLDAKELKKLKPKLISGLAPQPIYMRNYPKGRSAAHIIGYVRSTGKLPDGPINYGDPLWENTYGVEGLEKAFDNDLVGKSGMRKTVIDSDGSILQDELIEPPTIGNSVVLTLNSAWQRKAEKILSKQTKKGALVLLDIKTGEVLTLASYPYYDINVWIPRISQKSYSNLLNDKDAPMFARAFQAQYPPASTFKSIVAAAALTTDKVSPETLINCPAYIEIGNKRFHNHTKRPAGFLDVSKALATSNNCWFYQVGLDIGENTFLSTAREFGFGRKTGLPLINETAGLIPTDEFMMKRYGRTIKDGDTANLSIGQGAMGASPLQVAQAMAGIANGTALPKLRLIKQIQKFNGNVLEATTYGERNRLNVSKKAVKAVAKGMHDVIHAPYGTGKQGYLKFANMTGKTGTAQWIQNKQLAWFSGFFPHHNPRFAYAALYEGSPGEKVSGGAIAAPIVRNFLKSISGDLIELLKEDAVEETEDVPVKAIIIDENSEKAAIIVSDEPVTKPRANNNPVNKIPPSIPDSVDSIQQRAIVIEE